MATAEHIAHKEFTTKIDIKRDVREKVSEIINHELLDLIDLYSQTKFAHWNVRGQHFMSLHLLFDKLAEEVEGYIDTVAERATTLGFTVQGTVRQTAEQSRLEEYDLKAVEGAAHVKALSDRFAQVAASVREAIETTDELGDKSTSDMFTEVSRGLDQSLWFLEAHLQK
ncbi:MAG: DNA starvation/stationary phase protection protein Dps [Pirellulales bacterium]